MDQRQNVVAPHDGCSALCYYSVYKSNTVVRWKQHSCFRRIGLSSQVGGSSIFPELKLSTLSYTLFYLVCLTRISLCCIMRCIRAQQNRLFHARLLLAEGEPALAKTTKKMLEQAGYMVMVEGDGKQVCAVYFAW